MRSWPGWLDGWFPKQFLPAHERVSHRPPLSSPRPFAPCLPKPFKKPTVMNSPRGFLRPPFSGTLTWMEDASRCAVRGARSAAKPTMNALSFGSRLQRRPPEPSSSSLCDESAKTG
jgi:hypothetical protein